MTITEDIETGKLCQDCEQPIEGYSTSPRTCRKCALEFEVDNAQVKMEKAGFKIIERKEMNYGMQLRLSQGSIVCVYQNKKNHIHFVFQGKQNQYLKKLFS